MTGTLGRFGEAWAAGYLSRQGCTIVDRNVRYRHGEIDIVAWDGETLVFVEVKCRLSRAFGPPEASITPARYRRLAGAVERYLHDRALTPAALRIDVLALEVDSHGRVGRHAHIRNAEAPASW